MPESYVGIAYEGIFHSGESSQLACIRGLVQPVDVRNGRRGQEEGRKRGKGPP